VKEEEYRWWLAGCVGSLVVAGVLILRLLLARLDMALHGMSAEFPAIFFASFDFHTKPHVYAKHVQKCMQ